ncbi:MAG: DUF2752 domain-containing protein [Bacteroidaceae bacterium]|nr:DUF2752 domain-containing protein [Bacteroidaceae bacterium]
MFICPFHLLTGYNCPFCGAQRMVLALLQGQIAEAFWLNPALMIGAPILGLWCLWKRDISSQAALVILIISIIWGIIRNLLQL